MILYQQIDAIKSREDLASFVRELQRDLKADPSGWENDNLVSFLDAVAAWIEDMDGFYAGRGEVVPEPPTWKVFGQILLAARSYE